MRTSFVMALLGVLAMGGLAAGSGVIVVNPDGAPGAPLLQAAIDAAQPGDIVLLLEGDYTGQTIAIIDKSITLQAEAGTRPQVNGMATSSNLLDTTITLRGLQILPSADGKSSCALGSNTRTWIEDCTVKGTSAGVFFGPTPAVATSGFALVLFVRSLVRGGDGLDATLGPQGELVLATAGGTATSAVSGAFVLQATEAVGGDGGDGPNDTGLVVNGGHGLTAVFASISLMGASLSGGDEGDDNAASNKPGAALSGFVGQLDHRGTTFTAGMIQGIGTPTNPIVASVFKPIVEYPATVRSWELSSPVRELHVATASVHGEVGDFAWVLVSPNVAFKSLPGKQGTLVLGLQPEPAMIPIGLVTDPGGQLDLGLTMPRLPVGIDGMVLYTQLSVVSAQGEALLGTGSAIVWLSATI